MMMSSMYLIKFIIQRQILNPSVIHPPTHPLVTTYLTSHFKLKPNKKLEQPQVQDKDQNQDQDQDQQNYKGR